MAIKPLAPGSQPYLDGPVNNTTGVQQPLPNARTSAAGGTPLPNNGMVNNSFGNAAYDRIGGAFKKWTGRDATLPEVSQWGTNVDDDYFNKIDSSIAGLDESKAYASRDQTQKDEPLPNAPVMQTGGGSGGGGGGGGGGSTRPSASTGPQNTSAMDAYIQELMGQQKAREAENQKFRGGILDTVNGIISKNSGDVDASDPTINNQVKAFRGEGERAMRSARLAGAERARVTGTGTGAMDSSIMGGYENLGRNTGNFSSKLVGDEANNRRNALMGAAQMGSGIMNADSSRDLQERMNMLGTRAGLEKSRGDEALGWEELFQRPELARIGQSAGMASANNQNQQFYDRFAWDQSKYGNDNDNLLMQYLLNGS